MPRRRLLGQLFPSFVWPVSLAVAAVLWFAVHEVELLSLDTLRDHLTAEARSLAERFALTGGETPLADEPARAVTGPTASTRVVALSRDGEVWFDSARRPGDGEGWLDRLEVHRALEGQGDSAIRYQSTEKQRLLSVAVPIERAGQVIGVVTAVESLAQLDRSISALENRLIWTGIVAAALAALWIFLVWRRWAQPLEEMRRAAERFARGELGFRLIVPDSDELAGLAEALNQMSQQLQERISTIVRQNNEQRAVLSSMVEGVLAVDNQERVISLNKASGQLLGIDQTQAQGRSLQEVVRNADLRRFVSRALRCQEPIDDDVVLHGDHEGVLQARSAALHDAQGRGIGAVVVLNDVTDFRRLEHIRRDFVANVSHELKTPITSIKGFVETLLDGAISDPTDARRFLQIVAKQADRLDAIIEDLLSLSKIEQGEESGDIDLIFGRVKDVVDSAIHSCQQKADERQIHICTACEKDVLAKMNPALLEQAVINLLDNAIKYSEPGSEVQVLASQIFDEVTITISDRGCGITIEHLPRIFERFYRVDKGRSRKLGGTGLGLAIVKHIVQAHHGRVIVKSTPAVGSVFTIHLPRPTEHLNGQAERSGDAIAAPLPHVPPVA
ncbi:MAG TPA: ATP-binding protein [Pirellulales bacterium]|jgi:two-component system phosphate regulon sensor histidine kinase PhoR|nr:ATP-binding protein [Pirellulales bacterium]